MIEKHDFLMPDYYNTFACKMGKCRHACCEGWPITFSVEDYFRLMGSECSEQLRCRLDKGIKISLSPTPDEYAQILPKYDGNCPIRLEDGRCAIHAELGENVLADVCRLYPRGLRIEPDYECSCANSCEAVLEGFIEREEPIKFYRETLSVNMPPFGKRAVTYSVFEKEQEIKLYLISIIQNRAIPLYKRIISLGETLGEIESAIENQRKDTLNAILSSSPACDIPSFIFRFDHLESGIENITELLTFIDGRSTSVRKYGEEALAFFNSAENLLDAYEKSKTHFENAFPNWEIFFEHVIVNHMFFEQFPFQDRPVRLWDEFASLCAIYALMRFLSLGYMFNRKDKTQFIDMCAAVFRLVDHTSFDSYASKSLNKLGCTTPQKLFDLISL
ncbi:MAG: hypothetical protein E7614_04770 [Ruminococcaceae bacterium]|nr:hypothetical protein [Oscillospiraceae bacterium]